MAEIESLELKITGNAKSANTSLDTLIRTLDTLKTKINGLNDADSAKLGSLAKNLQGFSGLGKIKISTNLANQITAIGKAVKTLDGVDFTKLADLRLAIRPLANLEKSNLGSVVNPLMKLPTVMAELNKIDMVAFGAKIKQVAVALGPLADEMQKVANGFAAFPTKIQRLLNASSKMPTINASSAKSFTSRAAKATAAIYTFKRGSKVIASWINESNKYTENLNLFTVAMGQYADSAMKYANTVSEAMGIDVSEWIRNQGVFMTLATGFGSVGDRAATMSQQLTQLGYDLSSYYNITVEEAMQKLKSGFAGELEPLRNLGYDLSQAKLEAVALSLGIDKAVSSMTQAEKAELRYYAIMTQVTQVQGDMARTLQDPANQLRVLQAQLQMAARSLGNIFIPALNAVLPYVIAVAKVIRLLADTVASLFGGGQLDAGGLGLSNLEVSAGGASDAIDEATGNAKKLKKTLLGIDELNVMSDSSGSGSGAGNAVGGGFGFDLPTYDFIGEAANSRVNQIVEGMKEWLGITGGITSWSDLMDTRLGSILKVVGAIGIAFATWKITTGIMSFVTMFKSSGLLMFLKDVGFAIAAVATGAGTVGEAISFVFGGIAGVIGGAVLAVNGLIGYVSNLISILRDGENVSNILGAALGTLATAAGGFLLAIGLGATVATGGIVAAVIAAVGGVGMLVAVIVNHWEEIKAAIAGAWDWLYTNVFAPIGKWFAGVAMWFYQNVITPIIDFITPVFDLVRYMITLIYTRTTEIISGTITAIGSILAKVGEIFVKIVEIIVALGKAFYTYAIAPILSGIASIAIFVYDNFIKPVIDFFITLGKLAFTYIIEPIFNGVKWLRDQAVTLLKAIGTTVVDFISNLFKSVINGVLSRVESSINSFIRLLNGAVDIINKIPGVNITRISTLSIPRLADGGMIGNTGQLFVARERGPELVTSIGSKSAVMNNDQIVESVSRGVYQAVVSAMGQSSGDQVVEAKVNDKVLFEVMVNRARQETVRKGYNPLLGGV